MEHGVEVDCKAAVPIIFAQGQQVAAAVDTGVVHQHVDATQFIKYALYEPAASFAFCYVCSYRQRFATVFPDFVCYDLRCFRVDVADHHRRTFGRKSLCNC
ncbi:hypothetical protein D9M71_726370 [compost metagenome]